MNYLQNVLPESSFGKFLAFTPKSFSVDWTAPDFSRSEALDNAFYIPLDNNNGYYRANAREYLSERYGGEGLGANGGGARCGLRGNIQIKGIGKNSLSGMGTDYFHSYGGLGISEAILEVIWSEVCSAVLPHGGSQALALIVLDEKVPLPYPKKHGPAHEWRALLLRRPVIRPAHYMRSTYVKLSDENLVSDSERTRFALKNLQMLFVNSESVEEAADQLVYQIIDTFSSQLAAARAKRIMHGSLTASNIGVFGEWIDYGSISTISDFGPIIIPRGAPSFLEEELLFFRTLRDLSFYISKNIRMLRCDDHVLKWMNIFATKFEISLEIEFLKLAGGTEKQLSTVPVDIKNNFYRQLKSLIVGNCSEPFIILSADNEYSPTMPSQMSALYLPQFLIDLAFTNDDDVGEFVSSVIPSARSAGHFTCAYLNFRRACISQSSRAQNANAAVFATYCLCRNQTFSELYRTELYPAIEKFVQGSIHDVNQFIYEKTQKISNLLNVHDVPLNLRDILHINVLLDGDQFLDNRGVEISLGEFMYAIEYSPSNFKNRYRAIT